jgi:CCR4-NOT transcription complex subunit 1
VPIVAARSYAKDETTLSFSQKVVQLLYRSETQLAREVFVALLQRLCDVATKVAKEVTAWLIYAPDEVSSACPAGWRALLIRDTAAQI